MAVNLMIDRLLSLKSHKKDGYESLSSKVAVYSARLLKRPDQCKAVCASSHLFWRKDQVSELGWGMGGEVKAMLKCW